jgi:hypothetical protein
MYSSLIRALCQHETITRVRGDRMFTECLKCGQESNGIVVGHHQYSQETVDKIARTKEMSKAHIHAHELMLAGQ